MIYKSMNIANTRRRSPWLLVAGLGVAGLVASGAAVAALGIPNPIGHQSTAPTQVSLAADRTAPKNTSAFRTIDDPADPTFNQLLGINDHGQTAGYFGSGADAAHPNKGYVVVSTSRPQFRNENFPGSVQTQVTGINNHATTVGFYVDNAGANIGFVLRNGQFTVVANPQTSAQPAFNQLLGINNNGVAVGFYNDQNGASHGYLYNVLTRTFTPVKLPVAADSVVASAINDHGDVSGFYTVGKVTRGFLLDHGHLSTLQFGGKTDTQALGVNDSDQVVGSFTDSAGATHGFLWSRGRVMRIDAPNGASATIINGLNNEHRLVGFYVDKAGLTHGLLVDENR